MLQVLVAISQSFVEKRHGAMQKLFIKKERRRKKVEKKNGHKSIPDIYNNGYSDAA